MVDDGDDAVAVHCTRYENLVPAPTVAAPTVPVRCFELNFFLPAKNLQASLGKHVVTT